MQLKVSPVIVGKGTLDSLGDCDANQRLNINSNLPGQSRQGPAKVLVQPVTQRVTECGFNMRGKQAQYFLNQLFFANFTRLKPACFRHLHGSSDLSREYQGRR